MFHFYRWGNFKVAYVVNRVVRSYTTLIYSQYNFERLLISIFYFQKFYVLLLLQIFDLITISV